MFVFKPKIVIYLLLTCCFWGHKIYADYDNNEPINIIVPFAEGGATDILAKKIADKLGQELNTIVSTVNVRGVSGSIGLNQLKNSKADGQTLGIASSSAIFSYPALSDNANYNPITDFAYIGVIAEAPHILVVNNSLGVDNFAQWVDLAKKNDSLIAVSAGYGSSGHLLIEQLNSLLGIKLKHKAYTGDATAVKALESNRGADVMLVLSTSVISSLKDKKLKALAVTSNNRLEQLPNVPTFSELNLNDVNRKSFQTLVAPNGISKDKIMRLQQALTKIMQQENMQKFLQQDLMQSNKKDVNKLAIDEYNFYQTIVDKNNLTLNQ